MPCWARASLRPAQPQLPSGVQDAILGQGAATGGSPRGLGREPLRTDAPHSPPKAPTPPQLALQWREEAEGRRG